MLFLLYDSVSDGIKYTDSAGISISTYSTSASQTLYARWSLNYYTITYNCDDSIDISGMPTAYTINDDNIDLPHQTKDGYSFMWSIDGIPTTTVVTSQARNIIIDAIWTPIQYTIDYYLGGGVASNYNSYTIESSSFNLNEPIREGYTFIGWTGSNGDDPQVVVTIPNGSIGDLEYHANWKIQQFTISFESNGGSFIASITADYNEIIFAPSNPIWSERSFVGWYDSTLTEPYLFNRMPAKNFTLYAKWIEYEVILAYTHIDIKIILYQ